MFVSEEGNGRWDRVSQTRLLCLELCLARSVLRLDTNVLRLDTLPHWVSTELAWWGVWLLRLDICV